MNGGTGFGIQIHADVNGTVRFVQIGTCGKQRRCVYHSGFAITPDTGVPGLIEDNT